MQANTITQT